MRQKPLEGDAKGAATRLTQLAAMMTPQMWLLMGVRMASC